MSTTNLCWNWVSRLGSFCLALSLLTVSPARAQRRERSPRTPEEMVEGHVTRMTEELVLTDEQVLQVGPIIEEHIAKTRALMEKHRQQGRRPGGPGREEMESLRKDMEQRLEAILTEAQMQTYRVKQLERRGRMRQGMRRRGGAGR